MTTTDPISDMLTRIRNASRARRDSCMIPASQLKEKVLKILKDSDCIESFLRQEQENKQDMLVVKLKYTGRVRKPVINMLKRVSKPGCRIYRGYEDIRPLLEGYGFAILSTSKGVMKDAEAKKLKVGGEVLCEVW